MQKAYATNIVYFSGICLLLLNVFRLVSTARLQSKIRDIGYRCNLIVVAYNHNGEPRKLPLDLHNAVMNFTDDNQLDIHAADQWISLIPKGNGWVLLGSNKTAYSVSMYHQLHCLDSIRYDLTLSRTGNQADEAQLAHAHHCYNYLRQSLLCKSDVTLEPTTQILFSDGKIGAAASGSGVVHICKDWAQIRGYMEDNFRDNRDYEFWSSKYDRMQ